LRPGARRAPPTGHRQWSGSLALTTHRPAAGEPAPVAAGQWTATSSLGRPGHSGPHRGVRPDAMPRRPRRRSARAPTTGRASGAMVEACGRWLCRAGDQRSATRPGRGRSPCFVAGFGDEFGAGHVELNGFGVSPERVQPLVHISLDVVRDGNDCGIEFEVDVRTRHVFMVSGRCDTIPAPMPAG
jgi:hypothetical protein